MVGLISAITGGVVVLGVLQLNGRETNNVPARITVQDAPLNRESGAVSSYSPVIKRAAPSVVNIYSTRTVRVPRMRGMPFPFFPFGEEEWGPVPDSRRRGRPSEQGIPRQEQSLGSGVIVSPEGYILTANHVVEGSDPDGVKVSLASGGRQFSARIVGTDPRTDIAVLKVDGETFPPITLADSDKIEVGDVVMAIGNPFGVGQTVTAGIVSAIGRTSLGILRQGGQAGYENFIQTDAPINMGNSGGALIDAEGRLIGINTAIFSPSGGNAGIGFAVPVNMARNVMERLITSGRVERGFLGVTLQEISPDLVESFGLPDQNGAMVSDVMADTPAAKAGMQPGDVIRSLNDRPVTDAAQLRLAVSELSPGTKVTLKILRSEPGRKPEERTLTANLEALPGEPRLAREGSGAIESDPSSEFDGLDGVEVTDLTPGIRQELEVPENVRGALVAEVAPDSNSAAAGLRRGDIILEIDRKPVRNADEAVTASERAKGKRVTLRVWRGGGSTYMSVDNRKKD